MPKFKTTNQFKGFAFIEFSGKNEAKQAVRFIKENRKAKTDEEEEEPIGKFPRFNAQIIELEKKINHTNKESNSSTHFTFKSFMLLKISRLLWKILK